MKTKLFDMTGKYALVTGSAGFLGPTHALALAEIGYNLILTDIDITKLNKIKLEILKKFPEIQIHSLFMDVVNIDSLREVNKFLEVEKINLTSLVNNAAINPSPDQINKNNRFENFSAFQLIEEINVGLVGTMQCCQIFGSQMANQKYGSIINIASDLSVISPNQEIYKKKNDLNDTHVEKPISYSIIKTGLIGLTRYLSTYWAKSNVRVNAISPGGIFNNHEDEFKNNISRLIPMNRMAESWEIIGALQFLASNASTYVTGHNLIIDGGRTIW